MIRNHRFLILRRLSQAVVMALLVGGQVWGWKVLQGNLSASLVLGTVHLADPLAVLQLLAAGGALGTQVLLGAAITLLFYAMIGGRVFCAWVCPMNAVTDLANRFSRRAGKVGQADRLGGRLFARSTRFWILGLSLVLSAVLGTAAFEAVSPIGMLQRGLVYGMGLGWLAVAGVFLFDLVVQRNGFCGHLCPLGAFYSLVGRFSMLRVRHDQQACTDCLDCLKVCPENQILALVGKADGSVLDGVCTNCGRCIEVCRDDALAFAPRGRALALPATVPDPAISTLPSNPGGS